MREWDFRFFCNKIQRQISKLILALLFHKFSSKCWHFSTIWHFIYFDNPWTLHNFRFNIINFKNDITYWLWSVFHNFIYLGVIVKVDQSGNIISSFSIVNSPFQSKSSMNNFIPEFIEITGKSHNTLYLRKKLELFCCFLIDIY